MRPSGILFMAIAWLALEGLCAAVDTHLLGEDAR